MCSCRDPAIPDGSGPHRESTEKAQAPDPAIQLEGMRPGLGAMRHPSPTPLQHDNVQSLASV